MHRMVSRTRIVDGVVDHAEWQTRERDGGSYYIRDRVVVVPKGAVISDGTQTRGVWRPCVRCRAFDLGQQGCEERCPNCADPCQDPDGKQALSYSKAKATVRK
jgi:hypothetical protein